MNRERNARLFPGGCEHRAKYANVIFLIIKHAKLLRRTKNTDVKTSTTRCVHDSLDADESMRIIFTRREHEREKKRMRCCYTVINSAVPYTVKTCICNRASATQLLLPHVIGGELTVLPTLHSACGWLCGGIIAFSMHTGAPLPPPQQTSSRWIRFLDGAGNIVGPRLGLENTTASSAWFKAACMKCNNN